MTDTNTKITAGLPKGWQFTTIGEITEKFLNGGTPPTKNPEYWQGNIPWTTSSPITSFYLDRGECTISKEGLEKSASNLIPKNNVLISTRVGVGKVSVNRIDVAINQDLTGLILDKTKITPEFFVWTLLSKEYNQKLKGMSRGTTIKGLIRSELERFALPLPPLSEQRQIATILSTVDDAIQRSQQAIAETERLKAGVMEELMTKGIGHTKFKEDPDVRRVPTGWDIKQLGDVCTVKTGPFGAQLHMSDYVEKGTPIITVEHLGDLGVIHENLPLVSDADKSRLSDYVLNEGDIVFSRVGSVDRSCYISKKESGWLFSGRLLRVRPATNELLPTYLNAYFSFEGFKHRIRSASVGGTMANLNTSIMNQIKIIFPPLPEQQKIASILSTIDRKITLQRQRTAHYEQLKQGLMNDLLTGKRRVKVT